MDDFFGRQAVCFQKGNVQTAKHHLRTENRLNPRHRNARKVQPVFKSKR